MVVISFVFSLWIINDFNKFKYKTLLQNTWSKLLCSCSCASFTVVFRVFTRTTVHNGGVPSVSSKWSNSPELPATSWAGSCLVKGKINWYNSKLKNNFRLTLKWLNEGEQNRSKKIKNKMAIWLPDHKQKLHKPINECSFFSWCIYAGSIEIMNNRLSRLNAL